MTTATTPIAEANADGVPDLAGFALPDEAELSRWASALFQALPGRDVSPGAPSASAGVDALSLPLAETAHHSAAPTSGEFGPAPSARGSGTDFIALTQGATPPLGLSSPIPGVPAEGPSLGGFGASPLGLTPSAPASAPVPAAPAPTAGPDLYIVSEALQHGVTKRELNFGDWLSARPDLLPGGPATHELNLAPARLDAHDEFAAPSSSQLRSGGHPAFDVEAVRRDFPILREKINGRPLIWLDNGATTQKPQVVIDRIAYFYEHENSNVHRAAHTLAARATDAYENARKTVARFIGAGSSEEIVFVRGATEAINLVAQSWGRQHIDAGDEIIVSHLEHHANIVPWQQLASEKGAKLKVIPVDSDGQVLLSEYERLLSDRTKIVAITHVSNALGTVVPVKAIIDRAHAAGAKVLVDGAQSVAHARINVQAWDADFFVFSGHKIFAPTGIGVLYGKKDILNATQPWQGGGNMIADVTFEKTRFQPAPWRFEAGTGNLADAAGLAAALEYLERLGLENIARHEHDLLEYATAGLKSVPGLRLFGSAPDKVSVLSFLIDGLTAEEVGSSLDRYGIAVRAGHHCAQPILRRFGVEGTVRASLALYNTRDEIDCLVAALRQIVADKGRGAH